MQDISAIIIMLSISTLITNNCMNTKRYITLHQAILDYLEIVGSSRSENTTRTYRNALNAFINSFENNKQPADEYDVSKLSIESIKVFISELKQHTPSTESLYLTALLGFLKFLVGDDLTVLNLQKVRNVINQRARRPGKSLPQVHRIIVDDIIKYANNIATLSVDDNAEHLRNLRDRAFLLVLADTGLRVHEACNLIRGDIDWNEGKALIFGKGNKNAVVRFSSRSMEAIRDYHKARGVLDGASGRPLTSLPVFARHDRGAGKKIKPITPTTGRNIVAQRVAEAVGSEYVGTVTPHTFRHYFVTTVMLSSRGNIKLAQKLARHESISVTQRYAHLTDEELDRGYWEIFER